MYKILISGYYGFNNIGDESILQAVVDNLKDKLEDIDIKVLSQDPAGTAEKYSVKAVNRKSLWSILKAVKKCDLLISGGGSLLQDVTSKKSIWYYLFIIFMAQIFGKKVLIYSQGIGPITSNFNRKITAILLSRVSGIVVRDETSKEFLEELNIPKEMIQVTADPVLRINPVSLDIGKDILKSEGISLDRGKTVVGFAIKERKLSSDFVEELIKAMSDLVHKKNAQIVLIPFHFSEDMAVISEIEKRLAAQNVEVYAVRNKYLTNEMLSIIGNMDVLVGVRLHSLIHASIMNVAMIGISYDPKINSYMKSVGMKALCSVYDFNSEDFLEEFLKIIQNEDEIKAKVQERLKSLKEDLNKNEETIKKLMENV